MSKRRRTVYRVDWGRDGPGAPAVWAVGPWDAGEFAAVRRQLDPLGTWTLVPELGAAVESLRGAAPLREVLPPEVLLLVQERPGVDEQELVDRLHAAAPLVRVIVVAGTWCEGEVRTGRPPAGFARLYWHELAAWWRRAMIERAAGLAPHWAGGGELAPSLRGRELRRALIAVDAIDFAVFEALEMALRGEGMECVWTPRGRGASHRCAAGIWDGAQLDGDEPGALAAFCKRFARTPAPVVVLVDYPRVEHVDLARKCGAAAVLGKPYSLASLVHELTQALPVTTMFSAP